MKKSIVFLAVILGVATLSSCCKKHQEKNSVKTLNATIAKNETLQFDLGVVSNDNKNALNISKQASHYTLSEINSEGTSNQMFLVYTPAADFVGMDQVTVTMGDSDKHEHKCGGGHHHGGFGFGACHHHDDDDDMDEVTTYIINIKVGTSSVTK